MASQIFLVLVLAFCTASLAVDVESSLVSVEGRQAAPATIFITTTIPGTTTTYTTTNKVCGIIGSTVFVTYTSGTSTFTSTFRNPPTQVCRKRRAFYDNVFVGIPNDDSGVQFYRLTPAQVVRFEPTRLPQLVNKEYPSYLADVVVASPDVVDSTFARQQGPIFGGLISLGNFVSSLVFSLLNAASARSTVTSVVTVFSTTTTLTSFTSTSTYYLGGTCYPGGVTLC